MRNAPDGGDAVLQAFRSLGIDYVMSSPGSEWGPVWEAMAHQQLSNEPGPTYLTCAHENLAVGLAMGYTQITGRMQAVMLHTGVGLLQGAMGIEGALRGAIPMVILSGEALSFGDDPDLDPGFQWQGILNQVGGPARLVEPLVKWANQAGSAATLHNQIVSAGELAQRNPRAPVYLSVPIEVMKQPWPAPDSLRMAPPAPVITATPDDIAAFAERLSAAACPVIITEESGRTAEGYHALVDLAEKLAIPVVEGRFAPYANFPHDHPLFAGAGRPDVVDEADLVVTVACRQPWYPLKDVPRRAHVLSIDDTPFRDHVVYQPSAAEQFLEGDVAANLALLAAAVEVRDAAAVAARRARWDEAAMARTAKNAEAIAAARAADTISPALLFAMLSDAAPDDAIFVDETITHRPFLVNHLVPRGPLSYFRVHGGLGQAMGVALGTRLGAPERMVITTLGDGTFLYNPAVQAMAFAKEQGLATLTVVTNNHGYNAMRKDQTNYYPDGVAASSGLYLGHPVTEFEYSELAAPFGAFGARADTPDELEAALGEAIAAVASGTPALLNVSLDA
ncbi:MAG: thiamine pyrophosphate-binding protein [Alphaproteobacteria bacterium]|nr:thiamine pyrophosphate-binding protein [Alphaproteobacteria bacterium]